MNKNFIQKKCAHIALAGYFALLIYSSFHFHNINLSCSPQWNGNSGSPVHGSASDKFDPSNLSCQFNLIYGNSFTYDNTSYFESRLPVLNDIVKSLPALIVVKVDYSPNQLRAPPVLS
jgi:hypothetical protein